MIEPGREDLVGTATASGSITGPPIGVGDSARWRSSARSRDARGGRACVQVAAMLRVTAGDGKSRLIALPKPARSARPSQAEATRSAPVVPPTVRPAETGMTADAVATVLAGLANGVSPATASYV